MYQEILKKSGLTGVQAEILNFLWQNGGEKASKIALHIKHARGVVYKGLEELLALELIERDDPPNKVSIFTAKHPSSLNDFFINQEKELKQNRAIFQNSLPDITSIYNLANNKPGVRYYEGEDGIYEALLDTLQSKTEIYTFSDAQAVRENLGEVNARYMKKRIKSQIKKKVIVPSSAKHFFEDSNSEFTKVKFIAQEYYPFNTGMQIYDNKISYQTVDKNNKIAILIEDENIYKMHKMFFEYIWNNL